MFHKKNKNRLHKELIINVLKKPLVFYGKGPVFLTSCFSWFYLVF